MVRFLVVMAVALVVSLSPVRADTVPDFGAMPVVDRPGPVDPEMATDGLFRIAMARSGLYTIALDGPGAVTLYVFPTGDGLFDGAASPVAVGAAGGFGVRPVLDDLLLMAGRTYFLKAASTAPRILSVGLDRALPDDAAPLAGDAALALAPDTASVFMLEEKRALTLTGDPDGPPLSVRVVGEPGAAPRAGFAGFALGKGGVYPWRQAAEASLSLDPGKKPGMTVAFVVEDASGMAVDPEPNTAKQGGEPLALAIPTERAGVLLAGGDTDHHTLTLGEETRFDLRLDMADPEGEVWLSLAPVENLRKPLLSMSIADAPIERRGLTLDAGEYLLSVSSKARTVPLDYVLSLEEAAAPRPGILREPDDGFDYAAPVETGRTMRGTLGEDDAGNLAFTVGEDGHLWRLRGVEGVSQVRLHNGTGGEIVRYAATDGGVNAKLSLNRGRYTATLYGTGRYSFRIDDLGPVPEDWEREPNDAAISAARLRPGAPVTGDFDSDRDKDLYAFTLTDDTPLTLSLVPPDDGAVIFELSSDTGVSGRADLPVGSAPYAYTALLPPGDYGVTVRPYDAGISGRYRLALDRAQGVPDAEPDFAHAPRALPRDGELGGRIGGLDKTDWIFVPLPEGSGRMGVGCTGDYDWWGLYTYGDDERLTYRYAPGIGVIDYGPELGGALALQVHGKGYDSPYACRVFFSPGDGAEGETVDYVDGETPFALGYGQETQGATTAEDRDMALALGAEPGALSGLRCLDGEGAPITPRTARSYWTGAGLAAAKDAGVFGDGTVPFRRGAGEEAVFSFSPRADVAWSCALLPATAFRTPGDMGDPAPFTAPDTRREEAPPPDAPPYDPAAALALLSGGQPGWMRENAARDDLPATLSVAGLETAIRAYSRVGQRVSTTVTVRAEEALEGRLEFGALADGWRVVPEGIDLRLDAGGSRTVPVTLEIPPMQSPVAEPGLSVTLATDAGREGTVVPVPLDPFADDSAPHRFWTAPASLRGGLNVLNRHMGARLTRLGEDEADDGIRKSYGFLHDGLALDTDVTKWVQVPSVTFALAEPAPVAGAMIHLRTTQPRYTWPERVAIDLSEDGETWTEAVSARLTGSDRPQFFPFDAVREAAFARVRPGGCNTDPDCTKKALAEVQLIASPGWRPAEPVNIADPDLGGHVVHALHDGTRIDERGFDGGWNRSLISGEQTRLREIWGASETRGTRVEIVIGFHQNRAAHVGRIEWTGHPDDAPWTSPVEVSVALESPAGPWRTVGTIEAPADGGIVTGFAPETPVWARYVRLVIPRSAEQKRNSPNTIRIFETDGAPSAVGLWEDDRPEGPYEASVDTETVAAAPPAGGPSADEAVPLPLDTTTASSVQIERNEDWWALDVPGPASQRLALSFAAAGRPDFVPTLHDAKGEPVETERTEGEGGDLTLSAVLAPGRYALRVHEPPRSVAILWDTSGSVGAYIPQTIASVRVWAQGLQPGRDALQLIPFAMPPLLPDWAETPEDVLPYLADLEVSGSSDSERTLLTAAEQLRDRDGAKGIVVITDAETGMFNGVWRSLLDVVPRIVSLSIASSARENGTIMMDWAGLDDGHFQRVKGHLGLADGLDMAAALFRQPKGYRVTASLEVLKEPTGSATLSIGGADGEEGAAVPPGGAIEIILDASGSMLKRMPDGQRRIAVAREALSRLVRETLPPGTPLAFRAFGLEEDACRSELKLPFAPLDPATAEDAIRAVPAINLARTAIADSLRLAGEDMAGTGAPRIVVLVTDGDETCDGDVGAAIETLRAAGLDLRINIVGFAIDDAALSETFAGWARAGGGAYFPAGEAQELSDALREALTPRFEIERRYLDGRVEALDPLALGEGRVLPAGTYRVSPAQNAVGAPLTVTLENVTPLALVYSAETGLSRP